MPDDSPEMKRELGLLSVFSIAAGAMISSGLFVLPGVAFAEAGPAIVISYALASILMIPIMLSKAELATAMPKSGGSYFFIERSLGPLVGMVAGLANWLSISLKSAFALVGIGALATVLFPDMGLVWIKAIAVSAGLCFAAVNIVSVEKTGKLQVGLVLVLLTVLLLYCASGVNVVDLDRLHAPDDSFLRHGWQSIFAVAGMVFISFGGLTKVVSVAEEVRNPTRSIPMGMFLAFGVVSLLYVAAVFVTVAVVDAGNLRGSLVPLSLGAEATMGRRGAVIVGIGALLAFATTANAGILAAARTPLAMSRDGLVPGFLSVTSRRFGSPYVAIILTSLFIVVVIVFLSVQELVKTASTMMMLMFILQNLSVIIMRYSGLQNYRPTFRVPFVPWLPLGSSIVCGFLILEMGTLPLLLTGMFVLAAAVWYLAYISPRVDRESAFVYMVKNIISKDLAGRELADELKQITLERDEIALDRFDRLVSDAIILDIETSVSASELFEQIAAALAPRLKMDEKEIVDLFLKRERESTTVVHPGLAVPHVIVEGEHVFELLLVRCGDGVVFPELHPPVTTAFVLVGSPDERNYHLRALMAIAHIVENVDFASRWERARSTTELRDVVLLASRMRER